MDDPSTEQLDTLLALGDTDAHLARLRKRLQDLPEQQTLDQALADRTRLGERIADLRLDLEQAEAILKREDREVDLLRQRLEAEQQRLYSGSITNQKELASMKAEIDGVQRRIGEHEDAELSAMEIVEQLEGTIDAGEARLEQFGTEIEELEQVRDAAAQDVIARIAELEVSREQQRAEVSAEMLQRYEQVQGRIPGRAVGRLEGDQCTACGISLSYADVNALVEGPPLGTCPNCQRLIVV